MSAHAATIAAVVGGVLLLPGPRGEGWQGGAGAVAIFEVNPSESHVTIEVGKAGVFGFAGHAHEVAGPVGGGRVELDSGDWARSSVSLVIDASRLRVTGKGEPPGDVPEVQRTMLGERVLDVERYPTIEFRSRRVEVRDQGPAGVRLEIAGALTLHGYTREVSVPALVTRAGDGLAARGEFSVKQTDFGIEPVTAGLGTVRVRDELNVRFVVGARAAAGER